MAEESDSRLERSVEAQLRAARERGEFENLPGHGKPLRNVDGEHDEMWWIRQWLRREELSFTPPALAIRKSVEDMLNGLGKMRTERAVRGVVEELNTQIRALNRTPQVDGPPTSLSPLEVEEVVSRWRDLHGADGGKTDQMEPEPTTTALADSASPSSILPATRTQWLALVAAVALLTGLVGYVLGQRDSAPSRGSVEVGVLLDMIDHHDQAIQISLLETRNGATPEMQHFAHEILRQQSVEIGLMTQKLTEWNQERRAEVGPAMGWMGHVHQSDAMPGMASETEMDALGVARGVDADALFVRLMQAHHEGGADMAQYAADHTSDAWIKDLASRMARIQQQEIAEMETARQRAGLPGSPADWVPAFTQ